MSALVPKQKLVVLVVPVEAAVEPGTPEEPQHRQVEPEEPLVEEPLAPGPCFLAVGVLVVHSERVELVFRR